MITNIGKQIYDVIHRYRDAQSYKGPIKNKEFFVLISEEDFQKLADEDDYRFIKIDTDGEHFTMSIFGVTLLRSRDLKSGDIIPFYKMR